MTTTYESANVASTVQARAGIDITSVWATFEASVALVLDDVIKMVKVPKLATILDILLGVDDLDSGAGIVLDVGDGDDDDRFILGSTIGQAGGFARLGSGITGAAAADAMNFQYLAEDTIDIHVDTAPAGSGLGTLKLNVIYSMNQ